MATGTNNPPGSKDPRDLYANAQNLDLLLVGPQPFYPDRQGVQRYSWSGMEFDFGAAQAGRTIQFQQFLAGSGFEAPVSYAAGVTLERATQTFVRDNVQYRIKDPADLPYTLTGNWATESGKFASMGDSGLRQDLASATGAQLVRLGARTLEQILKGESTVRPEAYGAVGDGIADDTAALQAMLDAGLKVDFGDASRSYKVNGKLMLRTGHTLRGNWATITQTATQTPLFDCIGKDLVSANGLRLVGVRETTYVNNPTSQAIAFAADSATRPNIFGCIFKDFCYSPLMVGQPGQDITFAFNVVEGPGAGVLSDPNYRNTTGFTILGKNVTVHGNKISGTASGGIIGQLSENVTVASNIIHDIITEHGLYCDTGIFGLTIANNNIRNTVTSGLKVQNYDAVGGNSGNVAITGNVIGNVTGGDGIQVINTGPGATPVRCKGLTITGNVISNVGQDGISHRYTDDAVITGNSISYTGRAGIYEQNHMRSVVKDNAIYRTQAQGIEDLLGVGNVIGDNRLTDVGRAGGAIAGTAIHVSGGSDKDIYDNIVSGDLTVMEYGLFIEDGVQSSMSIWGNRVTGTKTAPMRFKNPAEPLRYFADNILDGEPMYFYAALQRGNKGREFIGTAAPTTGAWLQGDTVVHPYPASGGFTGWKCVVAGSPGTWRTYGAISAS